MKRFLFILLLSLVVVSAACIGSEEGTQTVPSSSSLPSSSSISYPNSSSENTVSPQQTTSSTQTSNRWNMSPIWNVSTAGIPFMDLSPDGSLAAAIDWEGHKLYLVKPDGSSVSYDLQENDAVQPVVSGVVVLDGEAYVAGHYESFVGLRIYSWAGLVSEKKHAWSGSVSEELVRSPSGNHVCYHVDCKVFCDGKKIAGDYSIMSVSDSGMVVISASDQSIILREGQELFGLNSGKVLAYDDRVLASEDGKLRIYSSNGELQAEKEGYTFDQTTLLRWTLIPTGKYIFRHEPFENTHVLTWNLTEVKELPGFPYFANENFVVTAKNGVIHCYSLEDFHEVFSVKVPGDSLGYIKLSDDGKVMLVSGEYGNYWLYRAG